MKLLYDHQIFSSFPRSGISRYFCELFAEFDRLGVEWECAARFSNNCFLQALRPRPRFLPHQDFRGKNRILEELNRLFTLHRLKIGDFTLFHSTYSKPYAKALLRGRPYVITVHDLTHEKFPELPSARREAAEEAASVAAADAIIVPSEATAADLRHFHPGASGRITVIPHGVRVPAALPPPPLAGTYLIHVGTRVLYRRFDVAARTLVRLPQVQMLCVGGGPFTSEEQRSFRELGIADRLHYRALDEPGLFAAYRHAAALLFPSEAEGFGLPVAEALAAGCVPVLSDIPVFREVGGHGALFFPVGDDAAAAEQLRELLTHPGLREELQTRGREEARRFTWERSAARHLELYRRFGA